MQGLDVFRVTNALARLQRGKPRVFGADVHGFRLNPTLPEADVSAFERIHKITLPQEYRCFLTKIGDGEAGPFYGIFPLGQMDDNYSLCRWQENEGLIGVLSAPFPLEEEWNDLSEMPVEDLAGREESAYDRQMDLFERKYWRSQLVNGALPICHEGCAIRIWLVVKGTQAGRL